MMLQPMEVAVAATGVANVASVSACLERLGARPRPTLDPEELRAARAVVLPGVGSFSAGVSALERAGLRDVLRERAVQGRPLLAICLGMQLLTRSSEEAPGLEGLGVLPAVTERLRGATRLPHFGWNRVEAAKDAAPGMVEDGDAYFAHTYALVPTDELQSAGWRVACTTEGGSFVSAAERGATLACQFHPELSGAFGAGLVGRWLARAAEADAPTIETGGASWS